MGVKEDVETTTFISTKDRRRVERPHSFHNRLLHEGWPKTKETSQIISLPETICRSTEKLLNRPVTNCKPLKRGDSETMSRDGHEPADYGAACKLGQPLKTLE